MFGIFSIKRLLISLSKGSGTMFTSYTLHRMHIFTNIIQDDHKQQFEYDILGDLNSNTTNKTNFG